MNNPAPPVPPGGVAPPRPPLIDNRINAADTLNGLRVVRNQFLSEIDGHHLVIDYIANCTQQHQLPVANIMVPPAIMQRVNAAATSARLGQRQYADPTRFSTQGVRFEFNIVALGAILHLRQLGVQPPTTRHNVRVPGFTEHGPLLTRGMLWMAFSTGTVVRGAAFPGLDVIQHQARSIVALEALATQTDEPVFTIAVSENEWTVFSLPDRAGNPAVLANRHTGVGHQDLLRALVHLLQ